MKRVLAGMILSAGLLVASSARAAERWVAAWGYPSIPVPADARAQPVLHPAPVPTPPFLIENPGQVTVISNASPVIAGSTIRQLVRVSASGNGIRLHFSNEAGGEALVLAAVHIARAAADGEIVAGSDHAVTFGGRPSVVIPSWAPFDSDPVAMAVKPLDRLVISIRLPAAPGASGHMLYQYVAGEAGDFTNALRLPSPRLMRLPALVSRVDVASNAACGTIIAMGDSITEGAHATLNGFHSWPDRLAERLVAAGGHWAVVNAGIGGNRLVRNVTGPNALARFDRDVLGAPGVKALVLMEGINDIGRSFTAEAVQEPALLADLQAAARQIVSRAHDHGIVAIGTTLTPYQGSHYFAAAGDTMRVAFNDWVRSSGTFDRFVDFDAAVRDPASPGRIDPRFDSADHLHMNDAGYAALGDAVTLSMLPAGCRTRVRR